jgi:hypothetical protein
MRQLLLQEHENYFVFLLILIDKNEREGEFSIIKFVVNDRWLYNLVAPPPHSIETLHFAH